LQFSVRGFIIILITFKYIKMKYFIKNMECECCVTLVKEELEKIGLQFISIGIGEAEIEGKMTKKKSKDFKAVIKKAGLELVENKKGVLLEKIKKAIHSYLYNVEKRSMKFSSYLTAELHYDYAYLSNFFSEMQALTIEKYMISRKIARVKELLQLDQLTLTEIAYEMHYSSVAHLSNQFKKITGLSPTHFKKIKENQNTD
jgi:AraC-like DNA-binding protein